MVEILTREQFEELSSTRSTDNALLLERFLDSDDYAWKIGAVEGNKNYAVTLRRLAKRRGLLDRLKVETINKEVYLVRAE